MTQLIQLENAANVRELGGYKTTSGKTIKRKKLIRSAAINELSETDQATMASIKSLIFVPMKKPKHSQISQSVMPSSSFCRFLAKMKRWFPYHQRH